MVVSACRNGSDRTGVPPQSCQRPIQSIIPIRPILAITMCPHPAIIIQSNPADPIHPIQPIRSISSDIQKSSDTIQLIRSSQPIHNPASQCDPTFSSYTTYPADAPSSGFPPSPAASGARHLLSSSAAAYYAAFFASNFDGAVSKADLLAFLIASPTGQSLEEIRKCLTEPH